MEKNQLIFTISKERVHIEMGDDISAHEVIGVIEAFSLKLKLGIIKKTDQMADT